MDQFDILIAGGGIAGLTNAIYLSRQGYKVALIEKKEYPFHRVCGEYVSNEVLPFLKSIGADILLLEPARINILTVSSPSGRTIRTDLQQGGIGISRYTLDLFLYNIAKKSGVEFLLNTKVKDIFFSNGSFSTTTECGKTISSNLVIGSFGKRSNLDKTLNRRFLFQRSPYIGVKYHIQTDHPANEIALHNFENGYCGISKIEDDKFCLCYLTTRDNLRKHGNIRLMEEEILYKNPHLKRIFTDSNFLYNKPEAINEISFEKKGCVEQNILMCGDSSGMITPLCGNGMAMAIHASQILGEIIRKNYTNGHCNLENIITQYTTAWNKNFNTRLFAGRNIQRLFGNEIVTEIALGVLRHNRPLTNWLIRQTHGTPF